MQQRGGRLTLVSLICVHILGPVALAQRPSTQPATTQSADSLDAVMGDFVTWTDRTATLLKDVKDQETAKAGAEKLKTAHAEARALFDRQMKLMSTPIDPAVQKDSQEKYGPKLQASMGMLMAEKQRIYRDPDLKEALGGNLDAALSVFDTQPARP
jgi:hypothetical protein